MFIFSMLMFFLLACGGAWLMLFPAGRDMVLQVLANWGRRSGSCLSAINEQGARRAVEALDGAGRTAARAGRFFRRHFLLALAACVVVTVPVALAIVLGGQHVWAGYGQDERQINTQVEALLKGEQLAVPAPLPPLAFSTLEVTQLRPMLDSANRNWQLLDPAFAQRLLLVFKIMKERYHYDMAILEGYRSPERQNQLAAAGPSVSNARAFQSYHQFGLAADCAFLREGKLVISERDPWAMRGYQLYGETAEAAGLHWGGRWTLLDFGHTELRLPGKVRK